MVFYNNILVGIMLNGIKKVKGKKYVWNGGISVVLFYWKIGIGEVLLKVIFERY